MHGHCREEFDKVEEIGRWIANTTREGNWNETYKALEILKKVFEETDEACKK